MIEKVKIEFFKGFKTFEIDVAEFNLIVGGNNSGKTSLFHALQLFFWSLPKIAVADGTSVQLKKTQLSDVAAVPYVNIKDIFYMQKQRSGSSPTRIKVSIKVTGIDEVKIELYRAFSVNTMIDGAGRTLTKADYEALIGHAPIYVPSAMGITAKEDLLREIAQDRLVTDGRQSQVLRNLIYRISKDPGKWTQFKDLITPLFKLSNLQVPFNEASDEWLTATYTEGECEFDLLSAGSGFLQVVNLISFLVLYSSKVALLDEPDSHMHEDLQRVTLHLLQRLSKDQNVQLFVASHSPAFMDETPIESIYVIDKTQKGPLKPSNTEDLIPLLNDRGVSLPVNKIVDTLKSRVAIFVEGPEADYKDFLNAFGEIVYADFKLRTKGLVLFGVGGKTKDWPFEVVDSFQKLIKTAFKFLIFFDADLDLDTSLRSREAKIPATTGGQLVHWKRRNRESYLLNPVPLSRLLSQKWQKKKPNDPVPDALNADEIKSKILSIATELTDETQAKVTVHNNKSLPSSAQTAHIMAVNSFFDINYRNILSSGEIPFRLLDSKETLSKFRAHISNTFQISFSDRELIACFEVGDIPTELKEAIDKIYGFFQ